MFSLSTSWNSYKHKNGHDLVKEIKDAGFDTIELNFSLTRVMVEEVLKLKDEGAIRVSSLHNICPLPDGVSPSEASPDYYSMSSTDEKVRSMAVAAAKNTILYASKLGARAVILHAGRVEMKDRTRDLAGAIGDKGHFNILKDEIIMERAKTAGEYFRRAMKSLEELVPYSKDMEIALAIENRYYYREIPLLEEMEEIFNNFGAGDLFYWHDVGHAEVFDRLGLVSHKGLLDRFQKRLLGMHLHDIIGVINDHQAPGFGTFDFKMIRPYIGKETLMVIEAHGPATADELRRSVKYLNKVLG